MQQADALVASGMRDAGYQYLIVQECIAPGRNAAGELVADGKRFPHGLKFLADYIHARGLLAGIYTDVGPNTCFNDPKYQGSYDHENQDARTFAAWGFDLVEVDYCNLPANHTGKELYARMANGIRKTGRPMLLYICSWGHEQPWEWGQSIAQVWRTDQDISWEKNHCDWTKIVGNFESNARHSVFTGPNSWNDPDMLEVGVPGINATEARTHFLMWAISAAPLWVGTDVSTLDGETRAILMNAEVIAVDQDPLGAGPRKVSEDAPGVEIWAKPLRSKTSGEQAVLLLNLTDLQANAEVRWSDLGLQETATVRDLSTHKDLGEFLRRFATDLPPHGSTLVRVSGKFSWKQSPVYEGEWPGNERKGNTKLVNCGECSSGYAVTMAAQADSTASTLIFRKMDVPEEGIYNVTLFYARSAGGEQPVQIQINDTQATTIKLGLRAYGWESFPARLHAGENRIQVRFAGKETVWIDALRLSR